MLEVRFPISTFQLQNPASRFHSLLSNKIMITKKTVIEEIDNLTGLKGMVETYEEIAASRIKKTRESVLKSRYFMEDLNYIFSEVKSSYRKEIDALMKKNKIKDKNKLSFFVRNGKTLHVFISANTGLYGEIVKDTFDLFIEETKKTDCDVAIIGKQGLSFFLNEKLNKKYVYFDFPDNGMNDAVLKQIITTLISYEKVVVFFGKFQSIVTQKPTMSDISGNIESAGGAEETSMKFFFEPSLERILAFFEQEIFSSIFEQTVKESQLAKFAARIVNLDTSTENIKKRLNQMVYEKNKLAHHENNKKQLQVFSSIKLWSSR